ncbi:hypothetical protein MPH47_06195 [Psychrobacillus psychrodurans]|uniref:hypothetical protein n=1 Tax=Psychrobacillus psychrodurans TaxID=126157 RepID=UPI001F4E2C3D|nr:hypothetical protein [Psychrobacillus psychrodurans]MCK1996821.1 hypothetical protein [Psychrobacillus psychrodurans]
MNVSKHGIYVEPNHRARNGKTFQPIPNHIQIYATLTRFEDHHIVWLVVPFYRSEIKKLKKDGWKITEVWRKSNEKT